MKKIKAGFYLCLVFYFCGCSIVSESAKQIWGSSTKALENARKESLSARFSCSWEACFSAVLEYAQKDARQLARQDVGFDASDQMSGHNDQQTVTVKNLDVFIKDRSRRIIVVMGVPGSVDTTEVGVFFTPLKTTSGTLVEVSSLSTSAKTRVSGILFEHLGKEFKVIHD